ncbi:deoxyribonuclease IV [candidate division WWE3 bacterium]|nr:deoxyribonuclease IV [candidate division WWE3 bacterium]
MNIGGFVSASGGIDQAFHRAYTNEFLVPMFFIGSPQSWNLPVLNDVQIGQIQKAKKETGITQSYAHALYLANLASPEKSITDKAVKALTTTMQNGEKIGLSGVIFHLGSHKGTSTEEGLKRVAQGMRLVLNASPGQTHLIMENSVAQKDKVGGNFQEIGYVLDLLDHDPRATVCLDTCHTFASGYDYKDSDSLSMLLTEVDKYIGFDRLECLHVNDSQGALDSHIDRHANFGEGNITPEGFRALLLHPNIIDKPMIMEIPGVNGEGPSIEDKKILLSILK